MKRTLCALIITVLAAANTSVLAKTVSGSIPVSVQLVNGSTVGAYLIGGAVTTIVHTGPGGEAAPAGAIPIVRVNFDLAHSWTLVKRVTWDKARKHLTIDF
jgi:hypothetical protein